MREIIVGYWDRFADFVKLHHDEINTISTIFIALFTVVLARVARRQIRDARVLQRAYLDAKFGGIRDITTGELVGHVTFKNVGYLPAKKFCWLVKLDTGGSDWRPPKIKNKELARESVIPIGAEWHKEATEFLIPGIRRACTYTSGAAAPTRMGSGGEKGGSIFAIAILGKCVKLRPVEELELAPIAPAIMNTATARLS